MGFLNWLFGNAGESNTTLSEEQQQNDARRFATLLVAEIKLNNEAEVYNGCLNADLYQRLKKEIDRSRRVYEERVSPAVAAKHDFFRDEVVKTLAGGDASKLGPGWEESKVKR